MKLLKKILLGAIVIMLCGCGKVGESKQQDTALIPVYSNELEDGKYFVDVESSSSMFRVVSTVLEVKNGEMTATMTLSAHGYLKLFLGSGEEAVNAKDSECYYFEEDLNGAYTYTIPVDALNKEFDCAAWSIRKEKWYDRVLMLKADTLRPWLEDGEYTVNADLEGGTGRSTIKSPVTVKVNNGQMTAIIEWSSPYYDYMIVDFIKYYPINTEGNSVFEIPIKALDSTIKVRANTIAMSTPHEIEYTISFGNASVENQKWEEMDFSISTSLEYAKRFSIDSTEDGYALINIDNEGTLLIVPEGRGIPENVPAEITVLKRPLKNIYLAATSVMDYFCALDSLDSIAFSGTQAENWYIEKAREAMEKNYILYAGKYSAPDYEQIVNQDCSLAIESTMIYHTPEVKENLEDLGIPVLIDRSSYEPHPLGRTEWVKVYGALLGKEKLAAQLMAEQSQKLKAIEQSENIDKKVGFFYVSSRGYVNVRKSGDYVSKMIELAGGRYLFDGLGTDDNALSTMNMQMEDFYASAAEADILIYNSTIDGELSSLKELLEKCPLLANCKAVKNGEVWCTAQNMFQETMSLGNMIEDFSTIIKGTAEEKLSYVYRL